MKNIDIIVMGKTGAGKSTLINAVLKKDIAPTEIGQPVTKKNEVYSTQMMLPVGSYSNGRYGMVKCNLNMYDTVGLEIDHSITDRTLGEIRKHIEETKSKMNSEDIHLVWFCVNNRSNRFEPYELNLIKKLSIDYELPFIIVLTQCVADEGGKLEEQIKICLPEVPKSCVLAKDYSSRVGKIKAYGITELLHKSISEYKNLKVTIIERKLNELNEWEESRKAKILRIETEAPGIISRHVSAAAKIGYVSGGCIPFVHGICIKMVADLNKLAGFDFGKEFAVDIFAHVLVGIIVTPLMAIPILSAKVASEYVQTAGNEYRQTMLSVIYSSSDSELQDNMLVKQRLEEELTKLKKRRDKDGGLYRKTEVKTTTERIRKGSGLKD